MEDLITYLKIQLQKELPGRYAHLKMAPIHRIESYNVLSADYRSSAVSIVLFKKNETTHFILIKRPKYEGAHSSQIALPGGKLEQGETTIQAALRETEEEIGLPQSALHYLGELSNVFIPVSNFLVTPHVFCCPHLPLLTPEPREVDEILFAPIELIIQEKYRKKKDISVGNMTLKNIPYYQLKSHVVWGATAIILSELSEIIKLKNKKS